jgi:hypothetical protein
MLNKLKTAVPQSRKKMPIAEILDREMMWLDAFGLGKRTIEAKCRGMGAGGNRRALHPRPRSGQGPGLPLLRTLAIVSTFDLQLFGLKSSKHCDRVLQHVI